jgi:hypothetical protein
MWNTSRHWLKPLIKVPYKRTFWHARTRSDARCVRWHPADVNSEVVVTLLRGEVTTSARHEILNKQRYCQSNQGNNIRSHRLESNNVSNPTPILYIESNTWCGFFLSWPCVPTPNVRLDIWNCVETFAIHMVLPHRLKITFISSLKLIIFFLVSTYYYLLYTVTLLRLELARSAYSSCHAVSLACGQEAYYTIIQCPVWI